MLEQNHKSEHADRGHHHSPPIDGAASLVSADIIVAH